jgi:hypothetical protein
VKGHLTPVRLTEIPLDRRLMAAREACRREDDGQMRTELLAAALFPSDRIYWVAQAAQVAGTLQAVAA